MKETMFTKMINHLEAQGVVNPEGLIGHESRDYFVWDGDRLMPSEVEAIISATAALWVAPIRLTIEEDREGARLLNLVDARGRNISFRFFHDYDQYIMANKEVFVVGPSRKLIGESFCEWDALLPSE